MMRKLFALLLAVLALAGCSCGWRGYEQENLKKYIKAGEFPVITPVPPRDPTDREIEARVEELMSEAAVFVISDKPYEEGMMATLNVTATYNGEPLESLSGEITVWQTERLDEIQKVLASAALGKRAGESSGVKIAVPAGYTEEIESGIAADFRVSVLAVHESDISALTDENAGRVLPGCRTASEVREKVCAQLSDVSEENEALRYGAWNSYMSSSTLLKVPYEVYMGFYAALIQPYKSLAELKEITLEKYVSDYCGMTLNELEASLSEKAMSKTKEALLVHYTAKTLSLSYTYAELDGYAEKQMQTGDGDFENAEDYINYFGRDNVIIELLREKIMDFYTSSDS